jgi:sigma-E factor negative regulatory protein RseC
MNETISEQGIVLKSENGIIDIEVLQNKNCEECSAKIFCKPKDDNSKVLQFESDELLAKGDKVTISISGNSLFKVSVKLYFYPLLILVLSLLLILFFLEDSRFAEIYSFLISGLIVSIYYLIFFKIKKKDRNIESLVSLSKIDFHG